LVKLREEYKELLQKQAQSHTENPTPISSDMRSFMDENGGVSMNTPRSFDYSNIPKIEKF